MARMYLVCLGLLCILSIGVSYANDSFVFPDQLPEAVTVSTAVVPKFSSNSEYDGFYEDSDGFGQHEAYDGPPQFNDYNRPPQFDHYNGGQGHEFHHHNHRPHGGYYPNVYDRPQRPWAGPSGSGIVNQGYPSHRPSGNSQSNSQANSHVSNGYQSSHSTSNTQTQGFDSSQHGPGASSASSAASATTGIVNGRPVAAASAGAAVAGAGGTGSSSATSTSEGRGYDNPTPWFYRSRSASGGADGADDNKDKIVFVE